MSRRTAIARQIDRFAPRAYLAAFYSSTGRPRVIQNQMLIVGDCFGIRSEHHPPSSATREGLVYLIKSGPHYQIGRRDELERR
jgi:hypothetical protein